MIRPEEPGQKIIMTPEVERCSEELDTGRERARQRLKDIEVSETKFNEY